jgi:hypothetical protein
MDVPWCGPSSTAKVHTEKLDVRSDAALTRDGRGFLSAPEPSLAIGFRLVDHDGHEVLGEQESRRPT